MSEYHRKGAGVTGWDDQPSAGNPHSDRIKGKEGENLLQKPIWPIQSRDRLVAPPYIYMLKSLHFLIARFSLATPYLK